MAQYVYNPGLVHNRSPTNNVHSLTAIKAEIRAAVRKRPPKDRGDTFSRVPQHWCPKNRKKSPMEIQEAPP